MLSDSLVQTSPVAQDKAVVEAMERADNLVQANNNMIENSTNTKNNINVNTESAAKKKTLHPMTAFVGLNEALAFTSEYDLDTSVSEKLVELKDGIIDVIKDEISFTKFKEDIEKIEMQPEHKSTKFLNQVLNPLLDKYLYVRSQSEAYVFIRDYVKMENDFSTSIEETTTPMNIETSNPFTSLTSPTSSTDATTTYNQTHHNTTHNHHGTTTTESGVTKKLLEPWPESLRSRFLATVPVRQSLIIERVVDCKEILTAKQVEDVLDSPYLVEIYIKQNRFNNQVAQRIRESPKELRDPVIGSGELLVFREYMIPAPNSKYINSLNESDLKFYENNPELSPSFLITKRLDKLADEVKQKQMEDLGSRARQFLLEHNIDDSARKIFFSSSKEVQKSVLDEGPLIDARNNNAVLVKRINAVSNKLGVVNNNQKASHAIKGGVMKGGRLVGEIPNLIPRNQPYHDFYNKGGHKGYYYTDGSSKGHYDGSSSKGHYDGSSSKGHYDGSSSKGHYDGSSSKGHYDGSSSKGHNTYYYGSKQGGKSYGGNNRLPHQTDEADPEWMDALRNKSKGNDSSWNMSCGKGNDSSWNMSCGKGNDSSWNMSSKGDSWNNMGGKDNSYSWNMQGKGMNNGMNDTQGKGMNNGMHNTQGKGMNNMQLNKGNNMMYNALGNFNNEMQNQNMQNQMNSNGMNSNNMGNNHMGNNPFNNQMQPNNNQRSDYPNLSLQSLLSDNQSNQSTNYSMNNIMNTTLTSTNTNNQSNTGDNSWLESLWSSNSGQSVADDFISSLLNN